MRLPIDDYTFHAVLKCGRMVSKPHKSLFVEALDLAASDAQSGFVFRMTPLESSRIADLWPAFSTDGLLGTWRLSSDGYVKLLQATDTSNAREFLLSKESAAFVQERYAKAFGQTA